MATHDYVIDNSTGANVRADINLVLQAILTNNSSSSAPSTTAAYMWWADTTNGVLKIRNSSNNDWVELLQLDGTLTLEDGSASTPGLAFRDDLNTGIFSSAADTFNVATAGVERMELGATTIFNEDGADVDFRIESDSLTHAFFLQASDGRIGINVSSPTSPLHISGGSDNTILQIESTDAGAYMTAIDNTGAGSFGQQGANTVITCDPAGSVSSSAIVFQVDSNSEKMRIDSSGRLLIGTTSSRAFNTHASRLQIEGTDYSSSTVSITNNTNDTNGAFLFFMKQRSGSSGGNTAANNGDIIGELRFSCADGNDFDNVGARIQVLADGSVSSNNTPTRMVFQTNGGTTQPTEHLRIESNGNILVNFDGSSSQTGQFKIADGSASSPGLTFWADGSGDTGIFRAGANTLNFSTGGSERARLDSSGNVMIGVTSASAKLHVDNGGSGNVGFLKHSSSGIAVTLVLQNNRATGSLAGEQISFLDDSGTQRGKITNTTSSTTYATSSDYRLKENEVLISDGIERVKQLKPYKFNWKHLPNKIVDGFFAHEVENLVEDCVNGTKDRVVTEEDHKNGNYLDKEIGYEIHQMMDHSKLVPLLTAALQETVAKIEVLETKVATLEAA